MKKSNSTKSKPTKGMGNPAAAAAVSSLAKTKAGQDTISTAAKVLKWGFIIAVVGGGFMVGRTIYKHRFVKMSQSRDQPAPNITASEARLKADNLYNAMVGFGANYEKVKAQLLGVNYNGFVLIYNAFGKRNSAVQNLNPFSGLSLVNKGMTLTEWLLDQFKSSNRLADLRILLPGKFI